MPDLESTKLIDSSKILNITKLDSNVELEIQHLINSADFEEFVRTIEDSLDNGITFNELLSSKEIMEKALKILKMESSD